MDRSVRHNNTWIIFNKVQNLNDPKLQTWQNLPSSARPAASSGGGVSSPDPELLDVAHPRQHARRREEAASRKSQKTRRPYLTWRFDGRSVSLKGSAGFVFSAQFGHDRPLLLSEVLIRGPTSNGHLQQCSKQGLLINHGRLWPTRAKG